MMKCGGTSEVKKADGEVQDICDKLRGAVEEKAGRKFSEFTAIEYTSQVVAGTNYFVKIKVAADEPMHVHVRIFKPLPHTNAAPELHSIQDHKKDDEKLEYF